MRDQEYKPPICPLCGIRERSFDSEPPLSGGDGDYFSHCYECSSRMGTRDHTHTYYGSPTQVAAGTIKAGHSWRTTVLLRPLMDDKGEHIGYRCTEFDRCKWEHRFTPEEMEPCPVHSTHPKYHQVPKGVCINYQEHRHARGECDERGYITDYGREQERLRSDAANWDPGHYVER